MKAETVIKRALQKILVQAPESPLEADEYRDCITEINLMMAELEAKNIDLGYTPIDSIGDDITVVDGVLSGIISNLAIRMAPDFGGVVSPELYKEARDGMTTMRLIGAAEFVTPFPATLPIGSGNEKWSYDEFYSGE
jgi:hypothetical protein